MKIETGFMLMLKYCPTQLVCYALPLELEIHTRMKTQVNLRDSVEVLRAVAMKSSLF
jgi:hypothetical protein